MWLNCILFIYLYFIYILFILYYFSTIDKFISINQGRYNQFYMYLLYRNEIIIIFE